ncbi:Kunitz/Bovine pancreatic trypsin inhibitor domain protein [Cooperia oncophora]
MIGAMKTYFVLSMLLGLLSIASPMDHVCKKKIDSGHCLAYIPRYGFSTEKGKCVKFGYGGCEGNGNNFRTMEECRKKCHQRKFIIYPI